MNKNDSVFQPKIVVPEHDSFIEEERKAFYDPYKKSHLRHCKKKEK